MLFYTIGQGGVFVWMALCGMLIGLLYDLFRLIRCILRAGTGLTLALDIAWGACSGVALAVMLVIANRGELRPYVLAAALMGFGLYQAAASRPMVWLAGRLAAGVKKLPRFRLLQNLFR